MHGVMCIGKMVNAKVRNYDLRRFENWLKLSILARIVGLRLQDMDSMVGTTLTIEREMGLEVENLKGAFVREFSPRD